MKNPCGWRLLAMIALLAGSAAWAAENQETVGGEIDVLLPSMGHQLFGTFQRATADEIVFSLDCGPVVTFSWNQVKELQVRHKTTLQAKNAISAVSAAKSLDLEGFTIVPSQGRTNALFAISENTTRIRIFIRKRGVPRRMESLAVNKLLACCSVVTFVWTSSNTSARNPTASKKWNPAAI